MTRRYSSDRPQRITGDRSDRLAQLVPACNAACRYWNMRRRRNPAHRQAFGRSVMHEVM